MESVKMDLVVNNAQLTASRLWIPEVINPDFPVQTDYRAYIKTLDAESSCCVSGYYSPSLLVARSKLRSPLRLALPKSD